MKRVSRNVDIEDFVEATESREDFEKFLSLLLADFEDEGESWENTGLDQFLEALHAYSGALESYYRNKGQMVDLERPTWKVFADLLLAARVYE